MNWPLYALQLAGILIVFTLAVVIPLTKNPASFVSDFPPEIQAAYYASQGLTPPETAFTKKELLRKGIATVLGMFLFAWMAHRAGAGGYLQNLLVIFSYMASVAVYDTCILDWIFLPRVRSWRLPGTEHMDEAYGQKLFHVKVILPVLPLFLLCALLSAGLSLWLFG